MLDEEHIYSKNVIASELWLICALCVIDSLINSEAHRLGEEDLLA